MKLGPGVLNLQCEYEHILTNKTINKINNV